MTEKEPIPVALLNLCRRWSLHLKSLSDNESRISFMRDELPGLLHDRAIFRAILGNIIDGAPYPDTGRAAMFESEVLLYRDPRGLFSLRMYLWGPGEYDPVHDHNSWGVIGPAVGELEVISYRRKRRAQGGGHAGIVECGREIISSGQVYAVHPLDEGIHKTGNPTEETMLQMGVYGANQTGRHYVNRFDVITGSVFPVYVPQARKKILAEKLLSVMKAQCGE